MFEVKNVDEVTWTHEPEREYRSPHYNETLLATYHEQKLGMKLSPKKITFKNSNTGFWFRVWIGMLIGML